MIVVDCAAVVDALSGLRSAEDLRAALAAEDLHAPTLLDYEFVAALRGMTLRGQLSPARASDALTDFADLDIQRWPCPDGLRRRALSLAPALSSDDAAYVVLAEALDCPLLTRDGRLARSSGHSVRIEVR